MYQANRPTSPVSSPDGPCSGRWRHGNDGDARSVPVRGKEAGNRLFSLRQGSRSVAVHAIEFSTLAMESGWDEPALMGLFLRFLNESLKDKLATWDESESLAELIDLARQVNNCMWERHQERDQCPKNVWIMQS